MGVLPQALEIIFEVQRKKITEKITRRKISFSTYKLRYYYYYYYYSLDLSYFQIS